MKGIKDELQNIILRDEQIGGASQLKKIQNFLRGYAKTSLGFEKQQSFKSEETTAILAFAVKGKLFYQQDVLETDFISEGAEQRVYRLDDLYVIKPTAAPFMRLGSIILIVCLFTIFLSNNRLCFSWV